MSNGLNDYASNPEMREELRAPIPAALITKVNKGYGDIDTMNHAVATDRLNRAAPGWTYEISRFIEVEGKDGQPHLLAIYGSMTIGTVTRWEVGEVERPSTYGDEMKKALSDFIKRGAMRFGVGIELWSKSDMTVPAPASSRKPDPDSVAQGPDLGTGSALPGPPQVDRSDAVTAAPEQSGAATASDAGSDPEEVTVAYGEGASSTPNGSEPATPLQWQRLLNEVCQGNATKALNRVRKAAGTSWSKAEAQQKATKAHLEAAINGTVAA